MRVTSPTFEDRTTIPVRYTCKGENISPPIHIEDPPPQTKSLAIIMHDPDSPSGDFVHWVACNIDPTSLIPDGSLPGIQGLNDFRRTGYGGPCPSSGTHRYYFEVYALDSMLDVRPGVPRRGLETAMEGHVLGSAELMGTVSA